VGTEEDSALKLAPPNGPGQKNESGIQTGRLQHVSTRYISLEAQSD